MRKSAVWPLLRTAVGVGLLIWLMLSVDVSRIAEAIDRAARPWLVAGLIASLLAIMPAAARLQALFSGRLTFGPAFRLTLSSYFFNQLLPTGLGGDVYRAARLRPLTSNWPEAIGLLAFERVASLLTLLLPALGYAVLQRGRGGATGEITRLLPDARPGRMLMVASLVGLVVGAIALARYRARIRALMIELLYAVRQLSPRDLSGVFLFSAFFHAFRIAGMGCLVIAFGYRVPLGELVVVMALALAAALIPISVGALGIREGILVYGLAASGVPPAEGLAAALLTRAIVVLFAIWGALLLFRPQKFSAPRDPSNGEETAAPTDEVGSKSG